MSSIAKRTPSRPRPESFAAIGHIVDAVAGHVIDDDPAKLKLVPGIEHLEQVAREDAYLKAELAVIHDPQRLVEFVEPNQKGSWTKCFLDVQACGAVNILEQRRGEHCTIAVPAIQQSRTPGHCFLDPAM